jgi:hypothetical protein
MAVDSTTAKMSDSTHLAPAQRPGIRRLSSKIATARELAEDAPLIITPDIHKDKPSHAHETALGFEIAKRHMTIVSSGTSTPAVAQDTMVTDQYAYAFDIDGVLIRGGNPIPEAIEAMKVLNGENEYGIKV